MRTITIKSLVSIANIILYTALVIIFIVLGLQKWDISASTGYKLGYVLLGFAIIIFIIYHLVRINELKKTPFQLSRKHLLYMQIFYYGQYFIFGITLLFVILANIAVLKPPGIMIFWYVWFPIVFVGTIIFSILESIVRVEERIFIVKKNWADSEKWEQQQEKETKESLTINEKKLKNGQNPFIDEENENN